MASPVMIADVQDSSAPRVRVELLYNDQNITADIAPYLLGFEYTDHAGEQADEISLDLVGLDELWGGQWYPAEGDTITAKLVAYDWGAIGQRTVLPCGTFQLDDLSDDGPPDTVKLRAIAIPLSSSLRRQQKHRAWEKITLRAIATDIANRAGLTLLYDAGENPTFDQKDQTGQSDLEFLQACCTDAGMRLKVTATLLVIFSEARYEQRAPVLTLNKLTNEYLSYAFTESFGEVYRACTVTYTGTGKKKTSITATFTPPNAPQTGETLLVNERVDSLAQAQALAKNKLREKNRARLRASFTLPYCADLVGAVTMQTTHWRPRYDGTYFVESVTHAVGQSGSTSAVETHRALIGY